MRSSIVSGACAIIAVVFNTGCVTINRPMDTAYLDEFHVDCKRKEEQIALLNSMRPTRDDKLFGALTNMVKPWERVTNEGDYAVRNDMYRGMTTWQINQNLIKLSHCPPQ